MQIESRFRLTYEVMTTVILIVLIEKNHNRSV